jgi:hypothetical protein
MNYLDDDEYLAETLKILKRKFDGGRKAALLMAIRSCCWMRRPLPEWARLAFLQAYDSATGFDIKSWDEVFGRPHPKGTHLAKEKKYLAVRSLIWERVRASKAMGKPINKELFEGIGKDLGVAGSVASEIYYDKDNQKIHKLMDDFVAQARSQRK